MPAAVSCSVWHGAIERRPMMLILARHGETAWNRSGRYQGRSDPPLSVHGEAQVRRLANRLADGGPCVLLASPLQRAWKSACIIGEQLGRMPVREERLLELAYGRWEGLRQEDVKRIWPQMLRRWKQAPQEVVFPAGESLAELRQRVCAFLAFAAACGEQRLLAVTHDGVVRVAVLEAQGRPLSEFRQLHTHPASITVLQCSAGRCMPVMVDDISHLR